MSQATQEYLAAISFYQKSGATLDEAIKMVKAESSIFPDSWNDAMKELGK